MENVAVSCVLGLLLAVANGASLHGSTCRCVPDQWQGILTSVERQFDLRGGRTGSMENSIYVSYDWTNKFFAMTDSKTGIKAVADYNKGLKYLVRSEGCRAIRTSEPMSQMCLPEHAEFLGEFTLGVEMPVELWQFTGPYNVSMKTTVIQKNCVPITEEAYEARGGYASLTSSMFLDVTVGIKDQAVFEVPADCVIESYGPPELMEGHEQRKRTEGAWSLLNMLRSANLRN